MPTHFHGSICASSDSDPGSIGNSNGLLITYLLPVLPGSHQVVIEFDMPEQALAAPCGIRYLLNSQERKYDL